MRLVGSINRWIGNSGEVKPYVGQQDLVTGAVITAADLPIGSTFYEEDSGWEFIYRGGMTWELAPDSGRTALIIAKLDELLVTIQDGVTETKRLNGHMTVGSDLEGEEALKLSQG